MCMYEMWVVSPCLKNSSMVVVVFVCACHNICVYMGVGEVSLYVRIL